MKQLHLFTGLVSLIASASAWQCDQSTFSYPDVPGTTITCLSAASVDSYGGMTGLNLCAVNVTLTHDGTGDKVHNYIWLPSSDAWNGRFQGTGGGGYVAGSFDSLFAAVVGNYSGGATDAGHSLDAAGTGNATSWALASEGNVNQYLLLDFASRSIHDMTVIGKAITQQFYGQPAKKSYWNGCSTGGRQGMAEAQMYPEDYDGILANAPAINWNPFTLAQQWPYVVMNNAPVVPLECDFDFLNEKAIAACDGLDGLVDGVIGDPGRCLVTFDPMSLVNQTFMCDVTGKQRTFTSDVATICQKIWNGPTDTSGNSLWYGILPGTNFSSLAVTNITEDGTPYTEPFEISDSWVANFLYKDSNYNTSNVTFEEFDRLYKLSAQEYDSVMGTQNPDLSAFKANGGKLITWQGLADNLIMPNGTMRYYDQVKTMDPDVEDFYRVFFTPGIGHCGGGPGVTPVDPLSHLVDWVEGGYAPVNLAAQSASPINGTIKYENLCPYPQVSKYNGQGDPSSASSFSCVAGF